MSKENKGKKKRVITTSAKEGSKTIAVVKGKSAGAAARATSSRAASAQEMTFGPETFKWMGIGAAVMVLGYIMMLGGHNDDPNVWDPNVIYNWRILVLAPILILAGLILQIYAIFKK